MIAVCRGLLMTPKAPKDSRTAIVPEVRVIPGDILDYTKAPEAE